MPRHPTIGLVMIVKNEAANLPRLAESVLPAVDRWTIVDTGSTDGTPEVARRLFSSRPGQLIEDSWKGYGPSRNAALDRAAPRSDWLLTLDADDTLHGSFDRDQLSDEIDALEAEYRYGNLRWWVPRLLRSQAGWRWQGRAHEYIHVPGRQARATRASSFHVVHHGDGGNRSDKLEREQALLLADWEEGVDRSRTAFYLARTFEDMGRTSHAAEWYRRRTEMEGWGEETWYARWRLGCCLIDEPATRDEACGVLWSAWADRPWRPEPLWTLASHYRCSAQWPAAWQACSAALRHCAVHPFGPPAQDPASEDRLFVHTDVREWRMAYEISIAAWYAGEADTGLEAGEYLLRSGVLPPELSENVEANMAFYR